MKRKSWNVILCAVLLSGIGFAGEGHEPGYAGMWEGTKANGRHHHQQEPFGPIEVQAKGHGTYTLVYKGGILGGKDYTYGDARLDHGKLRFERPGMKIVASLDHGHLKGYMEHHGMKEAFTFGRVVLRSPKAILHAFHKQPASARIPSQTEFLRLVLEEGLEAGTKIMEAVHHRDGKHRIFAAPAVNDLGYKLLNRGETERAVSIFKLNVMAFPKDANAFDSLGEAYVKAGNRDAAVEALSKSLSLNPEDRVRENSEKLLKKLGVDPASLAAVN